MPKKIQLSDDELRLIMPLMRTPMRRAYLPHLQAAMDEFAISANTKRMAAFLPQLSHESAQLRYFEEIASGAAYEGRRDLGNTERGDGKKYKGRGPIQLTGHTSLKTFLRYLNVNVETAQSAAALLNARRAALDEAAAKKVAHAG